MPRMVLKDPGVTALMEIVSQTGGGLALGLDEYSPKKKSDYSQALAADLYASITLPYKLSIPVEASTRFSELKVEIDKNEQARLGHVALVYPKYLKPCIVR
jgi:hypothetical protein